MTPVQPAGSGSPRRSATSRRYLMCRPDHFAVDYAINVWMDPSQPVDRALAITQWEALRATYERLGHRVDLLDPLPGLPDMVFTANGAFAVGDHALGARFREPVRAAEAPAHRTWLEHAGFVVHEPTAVNEGEGDFAWAGDRILAGTGFRSDAAARADLERVFGLPVTTLELVDPRFYHLDTALAFLDRTTIAYFPPAFTAAGRAAIEATFPTTIAATETDATVLGLNLVSDGRHVVMATQAEKLAAAVAAEGFEPVLVDVSELLKAGGGVKCATLELHQVPEREEHSS